MLIEECKVGRKVNLRSMSDDWPRPVRIVGQTDDGRVVVHAKRFAAAVMPWELHIPYRTGRRVKRR